MQNPINRYMLILRRWLWLIVLGMVICGGVTYAASKLVHPNYQASATLILNDCSATSTAYDCTTAGLEALPTYAQLVTSPTVLNPVAVQHPGLSLKQLTGMVAVKPQSNTLLMTVNVTNSNPKLATELANEVCQSFAQFSNTQLPGSVQVIPAQEPTSPVGLKPSYAGAIGVLVGLGLALALIVIFEWIDDRLTRPEEAEELVGTDVLTILPRLNNKRLASNRVPTPTLAEGCQVLCANLNAAQAKKPFKLVMVTSTLADEGKSTVAANLACFMALSGKQVLLIDANLRKPMLDRYFQLENQQSLADAFEESWTNATIELDGQPTNIPNLRVLTAGIAPSNPAELLQSSTAAHIFQHFENAANFDYIIFDTPSLLPLADTQVLASYMQAVILVVNTANTPRKALTRARQILKRMSVPVLGIVINKNPWPDYSISQLPQSEVYKSHVQEDASLAESEIPETPLPKIADLNENEEVTIVVSRLNNSEHH
jgi:succinoglycan biosynthesis transport protein ExoP